MISFVEGKIEYIYQNRVIINQNGIGYEIHLPQKMISALNENDNVRIYTYMSVKEDNISLYGFNNIEERELFLKLITVNGVGPKNALSILDNLGVDKLLNAIISNDYKTVKSVPGIGDKLSKMICIDMISKIGKLNISASINEIGKYDIIENTKNEVLSALLQLGYQKKIAEEMIKKIKTNDIDENISSEELLALVLKSI